MKKKADGGAFGAILKEEAKEKAKNIYQKMKETGGFYKQKPHQFGQRRGFW